MARSLLGTADSRAGSSLTWPDDCPVSDPARGVDAADSVNHILGRWRHGLGVCQGQRPTRGGPGPLPGLRNAGRRDEGSEERRGHGWSSGSVRRPAPVRERVLGLEHPDTRRRAPNQRPRLAILVISGHLRCADNQRTRGAHVADGRVARGSRMRYLRRLPSVALQKKPRSFQRY
jgi:hypothetical protein